MTKVVVIKLLSGEEIIGREVETLEQRSTVTIEDPLVIFIDHERGGLTLIPYFITMAKEGGAAEIQRHAIAAVNPNVPEPFVRSYLQQTSKIDLTSKIQL